jgi:hypothetical protein
MKIIALNEIKKNYRKRFRLQLKAFKTKSVGSHFPVLFKQND